MSAPGVSLKSRGPAYPADLLKEKVSSWYYAIYYVYIYIYVIIRIRVADEKSPQLVQMVQDLVQKVWNMPKVWKTFVWMHQSDGQYQLIKNPWGIHALKMAWHKWNVKTTRQTHQIPRVKKSGNQCHSIGLYTQHPSQSLRIFWSSRPPSCQYIRES